MRALDYATAAPPGEGSYRDSHRGMAKARDYDRDFTVPTSAKGLAWQLEQRLLDRVLEHDVPAPPRGAVDFACGTGRVLAYLETRVPRCTGIDISSDMLAIAADRCTRARVVRADVTRDADVRVGHEVDLVTAFRFFLNAEPELRRDALAWIRRRLAPGGRLVANFHLNPHSLRGGYLRARGLRDQAMLSPSDAAELLGAAGFDVLHCYGYEFLPFRREGDSLLLPAARRLTERALLGRPRLLPVAGAFLVVATPG